MSAKQVFVQSYGVRTYLNSARSALGGLGLSVGSYHRILKIARTIADLAHEEDITAEHLNEAIQYRCLIFEGFAA